MAFRQVHGAAPAPGSASATLPLTGERTVPGVAEENYWFRRHEVAYLFAQPLVAGQRVVEVGCGEGYGTATLSRVAASTVGIDYDAMTVAHAASSYRQAWFVRANLAALPIASESADVLASLQVIEHVWNHPEFLRECVRILRPGAMLVLSTPNRLTFSPGLDSPINPFHTREFSAAELCELLTGNGLRVELVAGVHAGERLQRLDRVHQGSFVDAQLACPPAQWSPRLRADVESVVSADFPVLSAVEAPIDRSLDLIVVARTKGTP